MNDKVRILWSNKAVKAELPLHITADKKEIRDFPKLPSATSFIRQPLYAIAIREVD